MQTIKMDIDYNLLLNFYQFRQTFKFVVGVPMFNKLHILQLVYYYKRRKASKR